MEAHYIHNDYGLFLVVQIFQGMLTKHILMILIVAMTVKE